MRPFLLLFLISFAATSSVFSQTVNSKNETHPTVRLLEKKVTTSESIKSAIVRKSPKTPNKDSNTISNNSPIYEKSTFPKNQKAGPAIFYVKNDQPVDQHEFMVDLKNESQKNKKP